MVRARRGGRRGRGRLGQRRYHQQQTESVDVPGPGVVLENFDVKESFDRTVSSILTGASTFKTHYDAQNHNRTRYLAVLLLIRSKSVQLSDGSKTKALSAAWARHDYDLAQAMLDLPDEEFALKEVLKAVSILDAGRKKRAQEKLLKRLEAQGCKKRGKMAQLKSNISSLAQEVPPVGSLSGALIRHVKNWFKTIPAERLSFFALHFPTEPWKKLADICHLHPDKDMPQCPWFLPFVFGKEIPKESGDASQEAGSDELTAENISSKVLELQIDYTVARKFKEDLTDEAKEKIASYAPIDTVLWYYEELCSPRLDSILKERLDNGEQLSLPYGKLMERLQTFIEIRERKEHEREYEKRNEANDIEGNNLDDEKTDDAKKLPFIENMFPIAEGKLEKLSLNLESPVVVIGDKSGSMSVAIRTSNIIASILSKVARADLVFFDQNNVLPPFIPKTVKEVMTLSKLIAADNTTNPAASLYPYYKEKKVVKTFIIVTDEGENGVFDNCNFAQMFKKYHEEVYPALLVFISIVNYSGHQMINSLKKVAPHIKPLCFEFMESRPDLTKLESVLGTLSLSSPDFKDSIDVVEEKIKTQELKAVFQSLKI